MFWALRPGVVSGTGTIVVIDTMRHFVYLPLNAVGMGIRNCIHIGVKAVEYIATTRSPRIVIITDHCQGITAEKLP